MSALWSITLGDLLADRAARFPDRNAVTYVECDFTRNWKELNDECDRLAKGFMALGVQKGDHVLMWATNVPEWILTLFAVAKAGAVLVTVNTNYKRYEAEYLLSQSDGKVCVFIDGFKDTSYMEIVRQICPEVETSDPDALSIQKLPHMKHLLYVGENETPRGVRHFADLYALADTVSDEAYAARKASLHPDDVVNMQYTSGTTGFPKGVMLTHNNIINNGKSIGDCMKFTEEDRLCIPVPFFHCFGLVLAIMASITHATSMVPLTYYRPLLTMQAMQNEKCTAVHGVPTMFIAMLEHPEFQNFTFDHLRTGIMAGSPCPIKVMQQVADEMGMRDITIVFGQTESSPGCTQTTTDDSLELRVSTVGRVLPGVEAKIVDPETGNPLPPHQPGEFCTRGYHVMQGYYNMPEATKLAIDEDGWLHTGDIATVDENGYYRITGRIKDMIIRGGENISPKEIEDFLYTHPAVRDVQVIGVPSQQYGEEVMACIVRREGETLTEQEVIDYVRANMARHKTPRHVRFVDAFPLTASGKIQKFKMREEAEQWLSTGGSTMV